MLLSLSALTKGYNSEAPNIYAGFTKDNLKDVISKGYLSGTEAFFNLTQNIKDSDVIFINFNKGSGIFVFDASQDRLILPKAFLKDYESDISPIRDDSLIGPVPIPPPGLKPSTAFNVPFIFRLDPDKTNLSEKITISMDGNNLSNVTEVIFGNDRMEFIVLSDEKINFNVPELKEQREYDVYAKNAFGVSNHKEFQFKQTNSPVIARINPNKGSLNSSVLIKIKGKNFSKVTNVVFGGKNVSPSDITETRLKIIPPKGDKLGTVPIYLESPEGKSNKVEYEYISEEVIKSITPNFGPLKGGTDFDLELENLKQVYEVKFGKIDTEAMIKGNGVFGKVPKGETSDAVKVSVRNAAGWSNSVSFYYYDDLPSISRISPNLLHVKESGVTITITGKNFTPNNVVNVNNIDISHVNFIDNNTLTFIAPKSDKIQSVDVYVNRPGDGNSNKVKLFYQSKILPEIEKIEPGEGKIEGGDKIHIKGEHLLKTNKVTFNGADAKIDKNTDNFVDVITPPSHEGECEVILYTLEGQATCPKESFTYVNDIPVPP